MGPLLFFASFWSLGWAVFLLSVLADRDGRRPRAHTLLDHPETES